LKVNNFTELDSVLKNSFSKIKEDVNRLNKENGLELKESEKRTKNTIDLVNTKIKFLTDEVKKFKDYKNELINEQRDAFSEFKEESKANKEELKASYKAELEKVNADTAKLKDNFVKVMDILKDRLVTRKSFEENNKVIEKAILELVEKTKDIEEIKFNYFEKVNLNKQMTALETDNKEFKEEFHKSKALIDQIEGLKAQAVESNNKFVQEVVFSNRMKDIESIKEKIDGITSQMSLITEQKESGVDINLFNNEIEDIRRRLSSASELDEKLSGLAKKEDLTVIDDLKTKQDSFASELAELKTELKQNSELKKEVERLKTELSKSQHQIEKNGVMIDMIRGTTSKVKLKEEPKTIEEAVVEVPKVEPTPEFILPQDSASEDGLLKKTLRGIADFFLEEDDVFNVETEPDIKEQYAEALQTEKPIAYKQKESNEAISDTKFVAEIEKMFDEKTETPEINLAVETETSDSFLDKLKKGVVNFFFEEVGDEGFVFQSEEIEKEDEAKLSEPQEMPKVEIIEEVVEEPKKAKRGRKTKSEEAPVVEVIDSEPTEQVTVAVAEEKVEESSEPKKTQYMRSRRPRIYDEIQAEEKQDGDTEVEELTKPKKKVKKGAGAASLAEEDYVYYPEDYFY
jgi:hypothetical protein